MSVVVDNLLEEFVILCGLINNVGLVLGIDLVQFCDLDDWDIMVDINIKGLFYSMCLLLLWLIVYGVGVSIVNLGLVVGKWFYLGSYVYGGIKVFVE